MSCHVYVRWSLWRQTHHFQVRYVNNYSRIARLNIDRNIEDSCERSIKLTLNKYDIYYKDVLIFLLNLILPSSNMIYKVVYIFILDLFIPNSNNTIIRFINFYWSLLNSNNMLTRACVNMALQGSNSTVSNNITIISRHISKSRCEIVNVHTSQFDDVIISDAASVIRDILYTKHCNLFTPTYSSLFTEELNFMLNTLCTI